MNKDTLDRYHEAALSTLERKREWALKGHDWVFDSHSLSSSQLLELVATARNGLFPSAEKTESMLAELTGDVYRLLDENRKTSVEPFLAYLHERICNVRLAREGKPTRGTPERPAPINT